MQHLEIKIKRSQMLQQSMCLNQFWSVHHKQWSSQKGFGVAVGADALDTTNFIKITSPNLIKEFPAINRCEKNLSIREDYWWEKHLDNLPPLVPPLFLC